MPYTVTYVQAEALREEFEFAADELEAYAARLRDASHALNDAITDASLATEGDEELEVLTLRPEAESAVEKEIGEPLQFSKVQGLPSSLTLSELSLETLERGTRGPSRPGKWVG